jgi:transposase InsO family protein
MSKARAIITAVTVEGVSQAEAARRFGVSRSWVSKLMARYRTEGEAAFEPRSRRPRTSPNRVADVVNDLIVNLREQLTSDGLDAGPVTIQWHLQADHGIDVSVSTIRRRLVAAGLVEPAPKKRPKSSYVRFEAALPNETWQSDFTHIYLADGTDTETITWLDDHSRYALHVSAHRRVTGNIVRDTFDETVEKHGFPASVLTDNGLVYTVRFAGFRGGRNQIETRLAELGITHKHTRPNHPTTTGKVERFQQTLKKWMAARPPAETLAGLQGLVDDFVGIYNHRRAHTAIGKVPPAVAYQRLPKDQPGNNGAGNHYRIRHDRIDKTGTVSLRRAGRMHHISLGRPLKGTPVVLIIDDLDIRVINKTTGELIRHLTLNPDTGYQPRFKT